MRKYKIIVGMLILTAIVTVSFHVTNGTKNQKTFYIGTPDAAGALGTLVSLAQEKGYIKEELDPYGYTISVKGFSGAGPAVNEALVANAIDLAVYADVPAISARSKGAQTSLIAIDNGDVHCAIVVRADAGYETINDLKGKKVALPKGTYMQRYFELLVQANQLTPDDFQVVQMTSDAESAILSGAVDAFVWTETSILRLMEKNDGLTIFDTTRDHPQWSGQSLLVGRDEILNRYPELAPALVRAVTRASEFALENPKEATGILADVNQMSPESMAPALEFEDETSFQVRYAVDVSDQMKEKLNAVKDFLLEKQFISKDFYIEEWIVAHEGSD